MADREKASIAGKLAGLPGIGKRLRGRSPGAVAAVDIDGPLLRVVQAGPRLNRVAVTRVAAERLDLQADADRSDAAKVGAALARTLDRMKLHPGNVVMGVPRAQVILRTLLLPEVKDVRELASVIHLQVGKELPFRPEDAVIDFRVNRRVTAPASTESEDKSQAEDVNTADNPTAKIEVLVAVTKREVVEFYQQLAQAAGLKLVGLGWLSYANARCAEACGIGTGEEVVALVSLRPDEVGIDIVSQEGLLFSRGATIKLHAPATPPPGVEAGTSGEAAAELGLPPAPASYEDTALMEVVRSLHAYGGMELHKAVTKIAVVGATGSESTLAAALWKRLNIASEVLDPAVALSLPPAARDHAAGAFAALGLALGVQDAAGLPFDFINPKRPAVQRNLKRVRIMAGTAALAAVALFIGAIETRLIRQREAVYNKVKAEVEAAKKNTTENRRMRVQATTVQTWEREGKNWLDHYAYLSAILPPAEEIYITSFSIGPQGNIRLAVQARTGGIMAKLDKQLREAGYEVKPLAITPGADKNGYNFRSNVELLVPPKMQIDLAKIQPPLRPEDDISLQGGGKPGRKGGGS